MKTRKTENKKPLKIELRIPELELINLLNSYGYSIHPDYSIANIHYFSDFDSSVDISLIDCSQIEN
jgi:hypothetical protein